MIPIRSIKTIPLVVFGDFTGNVDINTIGDHTFTFFKTGPIDLKPNTTYLRTIHFTVEASVNINEIVQIAFPGSLGTIWLKDLQATPINDDSSPVSTTDIITSTALGQDTFIIDTVNGASISLTVQGMKAFYSEIRTT